MSFSLRVIEFDTLPDSALLSLKEIGALANRSPATIWREVQRKRLPPPLFLSTNAARWRVCDVRSYLCGEGHWNNQTPNNQIQKEA